MSGAEEANAKVSASPAKIQDNESAKVKAKANHKDPDVASAEPEEGEALEEEREQITISKGDKNWVEDHNDTNEPSSADRTTDTDAPPLPDESIPPLPAKAPPTATEKDDGWAPVWEGSVQAFYFYNRFTGATQWTNPRVPDVEIVAQSGPPGVESPPAPLDSSPPTNGYNPAIHGDYDPAAWYAQPVVSEAPAVGPSDLTTAYAATAAFNRFTGRFQNAELTPDNFNDENKSKRQMNAFFDVDAAANSHDGRSLKAERSGKKLTKTELKQFKEKRKAKKDEKRRAWLRD